MDTLYYIPDTVRSFVDSNTVNVVRDVLSALTSLVLAVLSLILSKKRR